MLLNKLNKLSELNLWWNFLSQILIINCPSLFVDDKSRHNAIILLYFKVKRGTKLFLLKFIKAIWSRHKSISESTQNNRLMTSYDIEKQCECAVRKKMNENNSWNSNIDEEKSFSHLKFFHYPFKNKFLLPLDSTSSKKLFRDVSERHEEDVDFRGGSHHVWEWLE